MELDAIIAIIGVVAAILSSAAYINFKTKAKPVFEECAATWNEVWNFLKDMTDGNGCDMTRAGPLIAKIEKCWIDMAALAPFVKDILAQIPKRK